MNENTLVKNQQQNTINPSNEVVNSLVLGSSSTTRHTLMSRLHIPFTVVAPDIDESPLPNEPPKDLVLRLAHQKALRVAQKISQPKAIIVSSDELLVNLSKSPDKTIGKPLTEEKAIQQLKEASNCLLRFYTSLCVYDYDQRGESNLQFCVVPTEVQFRKISDSEIKRVLEIDKPLSCAGAFRSEGLSVSLCERVDEQEPGSLMGLPLLSLSRFLRRSRLFDHST